MKKDFKIDKEQILFKTMPAKRRLIFRWAESSFLLFSAFVIWLVLARNSINPTITCVVSVFLVLFLTFGIWMSFVLRKNTKYIFTKDTLFVSSGVFEVLQTKLDYKEIVCYKKQLWLPDLLTKKQTATIVLFKIVQTKNGRKELVKDMICSMHGVKKHREISKLFDEMQIPIATWKAKYRIRQNLSNEWKKIKENKR